MFTTDYRVVFVQYSSRLLARDDTYRRYYAHAHSKMPGYASPEHYMELPHWVARIAGLLPDSVERSFYIARDQAQLLDFARSAHRSTVFLFSVMDCNLKLVREFARATPVPLVIGGYVDPREFADLSNVTFLHSIAQLADILPGVRRSGPTDYTLFRGERCIPRFRLSDGCGFRCHFCAVAPVVIQVHEEEIAAEVDALDPLEFELVYVSDKSFGEARNWKFLESVGGGIARRHPNFLGFSVQTTPAIASRDGFMEACKDFGVHYMEFGVEICDDKWLRALGKPHRTHQMDTVVGKARELGIRVIPDLLPGIPGASYWSTVEWIEANVDVIPAVNVSWLAVEDGAPDPEAVVGRLAGSADDRDQSSFGKSWLAPQERADQVRAIEAIFDLTAPGWAT